MTNDKGSTHAKMMQRHRASAEAPSDFVIASSTDIRHSISQAEVIASSAELGRLIQEVEAADRIALDTEADSLHSYREKLCLLQMSVPVANGKDGALRPAVGAARRPSHHDLIVDPLADMELEPLRVALQPKEIVLHGADYDLRMLRRGFDFIAHKIFDTQIAARLLGIREFSLAALVKRYFDLELPKGSQKANWAKRPLPARMAEYAINDVRYLLPLAERLEADLEGSGRRDWQRQSCERAIEQAAVTRARKQDEFWRIKGSGSVEGLAAAVLRSLWQWRETEAERIDRPPFHILQNENLLKAAVTFASGSIPDYKHFSPRRRRAFRDAGESALALPESEWPVLPRRFGKRPSSEIVRQTEELRSRRDKSAEELGLEQSFIAPRSTLEAIAADATRAAALLVPWQRELLGLE